MLLRPRPDFYRTSHPTAADVLLLVEVADSSLAWDRGPKLALYARHGVAEVWIVDLTGRAVEVFGSPARTAMPSGGRWSRASSRRCLCRHWRSTSLPSSEPDSS